MKKKYINAGKHDPAEHNVTCTCPSCRNAMRYRVAKVNVPTPLLVIADILLAVFTLLTFLILSALLVSFLTGIVTNVAQQDNMPTTAAVAAQTITGIGAGCYAGMIFLYPKAHMAIRRFLIRQATYEVDPVGEYVAQHGQKTIND